MNYSLLLPHRFRVIGLVLLVPALVLGLYYLVDEDLYFLGEFTDESIGTILLAALLMSSFSKISQEDELTIRLRQDAFLIAMYLHALVIAASLWSIYEDAYFTFMTINLFLPLLLFQIVFTIKLIRFNKEAKS